MGISSTLFSRWVSFHQPGPLQLMIFGMFSHLPRLFWWYMLICLYPLLFLTYIFPILVIPYLVGGSNPSENKNISQIGQFFPGKGRNKKCLKPPPCYIDNFAVLIAVYCFHFRPWFSHVQLRVWSTIFHLEDQVGFSPVVASCGKGGNFIK